MRVPVLLVAALANVAGTSPSAESTVDYLDPDYGSKIRQLKNDDGHEHNLYYHRNPWNADNSRMVGVQSDLQQRNWRVVLYDGDGDFIKTLFSIDKFDWRLVWDRKNPHVLYTWKGSKLYRFHVTTGKPELLNSFAPLGLKPNGPSLNQAGDRILVVTSDGTFRSYRLPDMTEERTFTLSVPADCNLSWDKVRYIGCRNYIDTKYRSGDMKKQAIVVYDDTGEVVHTFDGIGGGGHYDFSPDGKLAYFTMSRGPRQGGERPLEIHVVNLDGTNDRVLFSAPRSETKYVQNLHLSWPDQVGDWFIASFFPSSRNLPPAYQPLLDEILLVKTDGTHEYLARTETKYWTERGRGRSGDMFWAQPLASPSSDGSRVSFNSIRSGTIDLHILYVEKR